MDRTQKIIIAIISLIAVVALIAVKGQIKSDVQFAPPPFDSAVQSGIPNVNEADNYRPLELPISKGKCNLSLCASPSYSEGKLNVYFTSEKENTVYVRIIILDENENEIGTSGLVKAGEYIASVDVSKTLNSGDKLTAKFVTYSPDTYYSMGVASAALMVQ